MIVLKITLHFLQYYLFSPVILRKFTINYNRQAHLSCAVNAKCSLCYHPESPQDLLAVPLGAAGYVGGCQFESMGQL